MLESRIRKLRATPTLLTAALLLIVVLLSPAVGAATSARDVVDRFHESLLSVWRDADSLTATQRFERLQAPVESAFNLREMIEFAAGAAWKDASDAEREALLTAFTRYSVANYANRFDGYNGGTFATLGESEGPRGRTIVNTEIIVPDDEPVPISYVVEDESGSALVIDVVAKGVSELARLRADYRAVIKSEGTAGLTARIDALASKLLAQ